MANEVWGLSDLTYTPFVLMGQNDMKLTFKVSGGSTYIDVAKNGGRQQQSDVFRSISAIHREVILDVIQKIQDAGPETRMPIVISRFVKEERKFATDYILEFVKDSKMVYHINVIIKGATFEFTLNGPAGISIGSDPLSDAQRSTYTLRALKDWFKFKSVIQSVLSNKRRDPSTFRNGSRSTNGPRVENERAGGMSDMAPTPTDDNGSQYF